MKRTLLVLALAVLSSAGCRAMGSKCGQPCANSCGTSCQPCHVTMHQNAPRPDGCCEDCSDRVGVGGDLETNCPGGDCCVFDRYQGYPDPGYPAGDYDCSPCGSPDWGCTGYRHPHGYVDNRRCRLCDNGQCGPQHVAHCGRCGRNYTYCGTGPAPGCNCCPFCGCGPSGDHIYDFNPGPPVAQTAYPYYTLRGPRDYLLNNPPSIGPY
jgi:hypothetical protein